MLPSILLYMCFRVIVAVVVSAYFRHYESTIHNYWTSIFLRLNLNQLIFYCSLGAASCLVGIGFLVSLLWSKSDLWSCEECRTIWTYVHNWCCSRAIADLIFSLGLPCRWLRSISTIICCWVKNALWKILLLLNRLIHIQSMSLVSDLLSL